MEDDPYRSALALNRVTFARHQFKAAYHFLASAMYCAIESRDIAGAEEVEQLAEQQWHQVNAEFVGMSLEREPSELALFTSLKQLVKSQRVLLEARESFQK